MLVELESAVKEKDNTESRSLAMEYVYHYLNEMPAPGVENDLAMYQQYVSGIALEEINALAKQLITQKNNLVAVMAPEKEGITVPSENEVLQMKPGFVSWNLVSILQNHILVASAIPKRPPHTVAVLRIALKPYSTTIYFANFLWNSPNHSRIITKFYSFPILVLNP